MPLMQETRDFLSFLARDRGLRDRIAAAPDKTLIYAGSFFKPAWRELAQMRAHHPNDRSFELLPDVLERLPPPPGSSGTLRSHVEALTDEGQPGSVPWQQDGFVIW